MVHNTWAVDEVIDSRVRPAFYHMLRCGGIAMLGDGHLVELRHFTAEPLYGGVDITITRVHNKSKSFVSFCSETNN